MKLHFFKKVEKNERPFFHEFVFGVWENRALGLTENETGACI